jgi:hypothetical protein
MKRISYHISAIIFDTWLKADFQRTNDIPFPPHANLVAHGMPVRGGMSSKFKMALSKKQLLLCCYCEVDESTNIPKESTIK